MKSNEILSWKPKLTSDFNAIWKILNARKIQIPSHVSPKYPSAHLLHSGNPVKPSAHWSHLIPMIEDLQEHFPLESQSWSTDPSTLHSQADDNYLKNP